MGVHGISTTRTGTCEPQAAFVFLQYNRIDLAFFAALQVLGALPRGETDEKYWEPGSDRRDASGCTGVREEVSR